MIFSHWCLKCRTQGFPFKFQIKNDVTSTMILLPGNWYNLLIHCEPIIILKEKLFKRDLEFLIRHNYSDIYLYHLHLHE